MNNNDVLRSVRHMLNVNESKLIEIIKLGGATATPAQIETFLKKEDDVGYVECPQKTMDAFLNGLIYFKRGKDESRPALAFEVPTNNVVLKKLRVAFELKEEDVIAILTEAGFPVSKGEMSALFRKPDNMNFRECGDQFLRNFLKGLTARVRK